MEQLASSSARWDHISSEKKVMLCVCVCVLNFITKLNRLACHHTDELTAFKLDREFNPTLNNGELTIFDL